MSQVKDYYATQSGGKNSYGGKYYPGGQPPPDAGNHGVQYIYREAENGTSGIDSENAHGYDDEGDDEGYGEEDFDDTGEGNDEEGPVKVFIGQVPKTIEEEDLIPIFSQFGTVETVNIIRDKNTGQHRGCAFVSFANREDAETCQAELHNRFALPGAKRPLQVRPATRKQGA